VTWKDLAAYALVGLAVGYLVVRHLRRRASGNCCGEKECPAAANMVKKINRARR